MLRTRSVMYIFPVLAAERWLAFPAAASLPMPIVFPPVCPCRVTRRWRHSRQCLPSLPKGPITSSWSSDISSNYFLPSLPLLCPPWRPASLKLVVENAVRNPDSRKTLNGPPPPWVSRSRRKQVPVARRGVRWSRGGGIRKNKYKWLRNDVGSSDPRTWEKRMVALGDGPCARMACGMGAHRLY